MGFGTSVTSDLGRQRALARAVLAVLVGVLAMLIAFSGGSFNPLTAIAQQPTPSPTGPQIEWLNPSDGTSIELSTKMDVDELYHLNTWVGNVPNQPHVEFEIIASDGARSSIGPATRRGNDAFDSFWNLGGLADGTYTLRAILFQNFTGPGTGTEVDRDEIEVEINNAGTATVPGDPEARAETIELTYPVNAGGLGVFTNTQGQHSFVIDGVASAGTRFARGFFSTTQPGLTPSWTGCGGYQAPHSTRDDGTQFFRIKCTLSDGQTPSFVTGVAMVTNDTPPPATAAQANSTFDDSADAHRALPYSQNATSVTIDPTQQHNQTAGACSGNITATVFDQSGRFISGINVDVHAKGPTDQLRFNSDDEGGRSANQAPNDNHAESETAWDCDTNETAGTQGEHNVTGADPEGADIKHIETTAAGTDRNGQFVFALRSDVNGATQFTAWADTDDNDRFCAQERNGSGSIGWGQAAPAVTALPAEEPGPCPARTASPSPTPTGSPSPTPTGSPSPTPTQTGSPSPSPTDGGEECPPGAICGDDGDNNIEGTSGDDVIFGRGGDDVIDGKGGNDVIFGEEGNDILVGGPGSDDLRGGVGDDTIRGGRGSDNGRGGRGADTLFGGRGSDTLRGGGGRDILKGNVGGDTLRGGGDNDTLQGGKHGDIVIAGGGNDDLRGGRGRDDLRGNKNADSLRGGRGNDALRGGRGHDNLNGGGGRDTCRGGRGSDRIRNCE